MDPWRRLGGIRLGPEFQQIADAIQIICLSAHKPEWMSDRRRTWPASPDGRVTRHFARSVGQPAGQLAARWYVCT
jgi:hypothetical protein